MCMLDDCSVSFSEGVLEAAHAVWRSDLSFDPSIETIRERTMTGFDLMQADAVLENFCLLMEVSRIWDDNEVRTGVPVPVSFHERSVRETEIESVFQPNADVEGRIRPVDGPRLAAVHEVALMPDDLLRRYFPEDIHWTPKDGAFFYSPECIFVRNDTESETCLRSYMIQESCRIYEISGFDVKGNPIAGTSSIGIFPGMGGMLEFDEKPYALELNAVEMVAGRSFSLELREKSDYMLAADIGSFAQGPINLRDDWETLYVDPAGTFRAAARHKGTGGSLLVVESELQEENRYRIQFCLSDGSIKKEYLEFSHGVAELEFLGELPAMMRLY